MKAMGATVVAFVESASTSIILLAFAVVGHKENGDSIFHYVSAKTQKALLEKLHKSIDEYDGAELTEDSRMTLGEWLDIWLKECAEPSVRPSTYKGYRGYAE